MATLIWLGSFARKTIRWRGQDYLIRNGEPLAKAFGACEL